MDAESVDEDEKAAEHRGERAEKKQATGGFVEVVHTRARKCNRYAGDSHMAARNTKD